MILAKRWRKILPDFVQAVLKRFRRKLAALLNQIESGLKSAFQILGAAELLDIWWNCDAVTLYRRAFKLQVDIL